MNRESIKETVKTMIRELKDSNDHEITAWVDLDYNDDRTKRFAIVLAWMDCDKDDWHICGKVAYLPYNSLMSEYDIDWMMPEVPNNDYVWDTELFDPVDSDIDWWIDEYENMVKEGVA